MEAEIQGLETREKLGLQRRYMFKKTAVEGDFRVSWSGIETEEGVK